ncbi:MAG: glycosyltransferase family 4 protein [Candidatus Parvarchaeota archaeon]|nr:glycosyltransferase family 4 protein [Candidatus Parvarchaeota archaeon]
MRVFIPIGPHPQYREIVDYPPKGVEYEVYGKSDPKAYYSKNNLTKRKAARLVTRVLAIPRIFYYKTDADLIFSTRGITPLNRKPWVTEFEHPYAFVGMDYNNWGWRQRRFVKFLISSKNCKRLMPNSYAAMMALKNSFDASRIDSKLEVVKLAVHYKKIKRIKHDKVTLLTIGNDDVYGRGFNIIKDAFPELKRKYDIEWTIKTNQQFHPKDNAFIERYGVKVVRGILSDKEMDELFGRSDIYVFQSPGETNSIAMYEAMRAGLPVVSTDAFAFPEKVIPGYNGFMVHTPHVFWRKDFLRDSKHDIDYSRYHNRKLSDELYGYVEYLVKHRKERLKMGKNAELTIKNGPLSVQVRNEKLRKIFESAIKR